MPRNESGTEPNQAKLRRRLILSVLFLLIVIMFIARQALSMMAPVLRTVFHLSNEAYERIVSVLCFRSGKVDRIGWGLLTVVINGDRLLLSLTSSFTNR